MASELRVNTITSTTGVGTVTLGSGGVSFSGTPTFNDVTLSSINGNAISGTRNRIINGAMQVWQRGTSFSNVGSVYTVDRFTSQLNNGNITVTQDTSAPTVQFRYSLKLAIATNATYSECVMRQWVEQQNIDDFLGNTITGSAWVKCSKSTVKMRLAGFNVTGGGDQNITFSVTPNTWTKISYTYTTAFGSATAWTSTANQAGAFFDIGFVDNTVLTTSDSLFITGVQLEPGTVATPFERRIYGQELALCQRYYQSIASGGLQAGYYGGGGQTYAATVLFPAQMRVTPTITGPSTWTYSGVGLSANFNPLTNQSAVVLLGGSSAGNAAAISSSVATISAEL